VREYIGNYHENADLEGDVHVVCHLFHCLISDLSQPVQGTSPDATQEGHEWLSLWQLAACRFYPQALIPALLHLEQESALSSCTYVGDIN
jgi:8-oxo-dGTP diphosphatase